MTAAPIARTQPARFADGGLFHAREYAYARLLPGSSRSWLVMLARGWSFCGDVAEPMSGPHGRHAVLMHRSVAQ
jgi:hypothetical protein